MATYNGVPMRTIALPQSKYAIKATYPMAAKGATAHNTYNDATAINEIKYMQGNNNYVSYHAAIDDKEVVFGAPLNRSTWHAGDGSNGYGNRNHLSFEICYSKSGGEKYRKAEANAVKVLAYTLYKNNWDMSKLKKHQDWSGKNCPHRILDEKRWNEFYNKISHELNRLKGVSAGQISKPNINYSEGYLKNIQSMLNQVGFQLGVTGKINKSTINAIQIFQRRTGLDVDGSAGPLTKAKLEEVTADKKKDEGKKEEVGKVEYKKDAQPSKSLETKFNKAVKLGITDGTYPQRPATREEVAVMIVNALGK